MDLLVKKNDRMENLFFSSRGIQDLFPDPLIEREKADKYCLV